MMLLMGFALQMIGQRTITGTITSSDGEPLIGANVLVKGSDVGTICDLDGKYKIMASDEDYLVFSYIGYDPKEVLVGSQTNIDIILTEGVQLDEVVVTALGIKKSKKSLVSSVSNLKRKELLAGNQQNLSNAIQGKVPGVTVTNSGGAPGASSVILIRGGNSLSGNNQPLIVLDGIPIDNSSEYGESVATSNRAVDMNSEDIESLTVLKGPSAAALYGIKAANGVVIITTKSGKSGKSEISYSGSLSYDKVIGTPDIQTTYGQGTMLSNGDISKETTYSWNDSILGSNAKTYNNLANFYQPALSQNHNLSFSGGNDKSTYYFSTGYLDQKGVIDQSGFKRTSLKIKADSKFNKKLSVTGSMNYINSKTDRTRQGSATSGSFRSILNYPVDIDMEDYLNENGSQKFIPNLTSHVIDNPYWSAINNPIDNKVDRFMGVGNITYSPFSFLNITYRLGTDMFFEKNKSVYSYGSSTFEDGYIGEYNLFNQITTSTFLLEFNKQINDFNLDLTLGNNVEDEFRRKTSWYGVEFLEQDFVGINNVESVNRNVGQKISRHRIIGNFSNLVFDWKSLVFLNLTGRYDLSSSLPKSNNGFFYPSVGMSVIASDLLSNSGINTLNDIGVSYWKLRASWAQVGKDAPPHVLATPMMSYTNEYTVDPEGYFRNVFPSGNPGIKPEFTNTFELGTDIRLFQNRLSFDFSYFNSISNEQILLIRMPPSASTFGGYLNGGSITNKGIELLVGAKPIVSKDFKWSLSANFSKVESFVKSLPGTIPQVEESNSWAFNSIAEGAAFLDGPLFGIYGRTYMRDSLGNLLLNSDGMVQTDPALKNLGDREPDWTLGVTNTFDYKKFSLSFMVDVSQGNKVVNASKAAMVFYGLDPVTLNRNQEHVFDGVILKDGEYVQNDKAVVLDQDYYQKKYSAVADHFIEDGSWIRLRYISLAYNLKFKNKSKGKIYVNARNLLILTDYTGVDPEVNSIGAAVNGTSSIGIDNLGTPSTKGIDLGFKFTF